MLCFGRGRVQACGWLLLLCAVWGDANIRNRKSDLARTVLAAMDSTADPCQDFYQYVCGGWAKSKTLPPSYLAFTRTHEVQLEVNGRLKALLGQEDSKRSEPARKAANVYQACMNEGKLNQLGASPMSQLMTNVFRHARDLPVIMAELNLLGLSFPLRVHVSQDEGSPPQYVIHIDEGNLGFPRDELLKERSSAVLKMYEDKLYDLMNAVVSPRLSRSAVRNIVDFHIETARMTVGLEDSQRQMTVSQLQNTIKELDWLSFLRRLFGAASVTITGQTKVIVAAEDYIRSMLLKIKNESRIETIVNYLKARTVNSFLQYLPQRIRNMWLPLEEELEGPAEEPARWEMCIGEVQDYMEHAVGKLYVDHHFSPQSKTKVLQMVDYIRDALKQMITNALWMDAESRRKSKEKLDAMLKKVGYPTYYTDEYMQRYYKDVNYNKEQYFLNRVEYLRWSTKRSFQRLNESPSKSEWGAAYWVNAFYSASENSFELLAGILMPPFFDASYPTSMQFGGIGAVIGHELVHGFDDYGRTFDINGKNDNWWTSQTETEYKKRASCFEKQYAKEKIIDNIYTDGKLTLDENIADNGGLKAAYEGYKLWQTRNGKENPFPGLSFSHDQLFFIASSQVMCSITTPFYLREFVPTDPHPKSSIRATVPASNMEAFARVFNCSAESYMAGHARHTQCAVW